MKHIKYKAIFKNVFSFVIVLLYAVALSAQGVQHNYKIGKAMSGDTSSEVSLTFPIFETVPYQKQKNLIEVQGQRVFNNWGIQKLGIDTLMNLYQGEGITTCICDTGVPDHPDLQEYILDSVNTTNNKFARDQNGHATHVGGIIAEILPKGKIVFVKVLSASGGGSISWISNGIDSCVAKGADIINLSLGTRSESKKMEAAINRAVGKGVLVVAAVGNDGSSAKMENINFPAVLDTVLSVGSVDSSIKVSGFSSSGRWGDVMAGGRDIMSTWTKGKYINLSGTSMAAPTVTGVAGLLIQHLRKLELDDSPQSVKNRFVVHAKDIEKEGFDVLTFNGIIQPTKVFRAAFFEVKKERESNVLSTTQGIELKEMLQYRWWIYFGVAALVVFGMMILKNK